MRVTASGIIYDGRDREAWRFAHPRAVLLPDGEVFVVYYAGDDQAKRARWTRVAPTWSSPAMLFQFIRHLKSPL